MSNFDFIIQGENKYIESNKDLKKAELLFDEPLDSYLFFRRGVENFFYQHQFFDKTYKSNLKKDLNRERENNKSNPVLRIYIEAYTKHNNILRDFKNRCNPATHGGLTKKQKAELSKKENLLLDFNSVLKVMSSILGTSTKRFNEKKIPNNVEKPNKEDVNQLRIELEKKDKKYEKLIEENDELKIELENEKTERMQIANEKVKNEKIAEVKIKELNKINTFNKNIDFIDAAITTTEKGLVIYINLTYEKSPFFGRIAFSQTKFIPSILIGKYHQTNSFNSEKLLFNSLPISKVEKGEFDSSQGNDKVNPSSLIRLLIENINQRFENQFLFNGSFYQVDGIKYRNILEILKKDLEVKTKYDALVVMMNPGSSYPIDNEYFLANNFYDIKKTQFKDCFPDKVQHQIVSLMSKKAWDRVAVINLLDICNSESERSIEILLDRSLAAASIFHKERRSELDKLTRELSSGAPIIIAWGTNKEKFYLYDCKKKNIPIDKERLKLYKYYEEMKSKILNGYIKRLNRSIVGSMNDYNDFKYPSPRLDEKNTLNWVDTVNLKLK